MKAWAQLLKDIVADPASQQRVMVDILNEPDSRGLKYAFLPSNPCVKAVLGCLGELTSVLINWRQTALKQEETIA